MTGALRAFYWEIRMDFRSTVRYRFGIFSDILIFSVLLALFLFTDSGESYAEAYGYPNYKELLVIGYLAWMYAVSAISTVSQVVGGELRMGTFYKKYHSKYPLQLLLLGRLVSSLLIETAVAIVLLIVARLGWGVEAAFHPMVVLAIAVGTLGMYGIGLIVAGLAVFYKNTGSIVLLIQMGLLFVTDTIPVAAGILSVSRILPLTSCNIVIKYIMSGRPYAKEFLILCVTSAAFLALGALCFSFYLRKARKKGNLLFY